MNVKRCLQPTLQSKCYSISILVLRVIMGAAFILHGLPKIQSPMGWMGPESPVPGFLQLLAAVSEFGGGIALILGLLFPLASLGIAFTMLVAVYFHMIIQQQPFVGQGGSYELAAVYFACTVVFLMAGPGKYAADAKLFGTKTEGA